MGQLAFIRLLKSVAKIWIEKGGVKDIEIAYSQLTAKDNDMLINAIDRNWDFLMIMITGFC